MFKGLRGRGQGRNSNGGTTKVPLKKGLFCDGVWVCNCDPRLPAQHFQTKNGGKNHGRWFYTCQKAQPKRCDFFLWDDEAKSREAAAVLNNSRTETMCASQSPRKSFPGILVDPQTSSQPKDTSSEAITPRTPSKTSYNTTSSPTPGVDTQTTTTHGSDSAEEEFYDWPASDEDELSKHADQASNGLMLSPETPRKAIKLDGLSTPGKRGYNEMAANDSDASKSSLATPATGKEVGDIFTTPAAGTYGKGLFASRALPSPAETPTPIRYKDIPPTHESELASEVLGYLQNHDISIQPEAQKSLTSICNKHVLYTRGIMKGRDVSRAMVQKGEKRMTELQGEIDGLKAEREMNRAVIRHLRRDIAVRKESES